LDSGGKAAAKHRSPVAGGSGRIRLSLCAQLLSRIPEALDQEPDDGLHARVRPLRLGTSSVTGALSNCQSASTRTSVPRATASAASHSERSTRPMPCSAHCRATPPSLVT